MFKAEFLVKPPSNLLECAQFVRTSSAVRPAASSVNLSSVVFLIRFEPTSELSATWYQCLSERELQLFGMQQAIACSVWQLRLRLPLIATRRAGMNLQPSFVCRPDQNL